MVCCLCVSVHRETSKSLVKDVCEFSYQKFPLRGSLFANFSGIHRGHEKVAQDRWEQQLKNAFVSIQRCCL